MYNKLNKIEISIFVKLIMEGILQNIKKDKLNIKNNFYLILLQVFVLYLHNVMTNLAYYLHKQKESLDDLMFDLLPRYDFIGDVSDFFSLFYFLIFFVFILHPYIIKRPYLTTDIIFTMMKTYIFATILRCISFIFTMLPSPSDQCNLNSTEYNPPTVSEIFTRFDMFNGCGDLIFSGHTTVIMIISLTIIYYLKDIFTKRVEIILKIFILFYTFGFFLIIIIARNHYTVDVVVAIYTVTLCFYMVINKFEIKYDKYEEIIIKENDKERQHQIDMSYL